MAPIIIKGPKTPAGMGQVIPIKNKKVFNKNKIKVFIVSLNSPYKNPEVKIIHYNIVISTFSIKDIATEKIVEQ